MSEQFETAIERSRRSFAITASQMRCPRHHKNAKVEVEAGELNFLDIEVFTCCEEFRKHVQEVLAVDLDIARAEILYEMTVGKSNGLITGSHDFDHGPDRKAA